MVKKEKDLFKCEACNMYYKTLDIAKECEDFCNKNSACNTKLIKHAVSPKK